MASPQELPVTRTREFWPLMGYSIVLGVFGAFFSLAFLWVIGKGGKWYMTSSDSWWGGHWWWVAVTAAAGVAVGLLRNWTKLPGKTRQARSTGPSGLSRVQAPWVPVTGRTHLDDPESPRGPAPPLGHQHAGGCAGLTRNDGPRLILLRPFGPSGPGHAVNFRGWP